jgi:aryl-alcohol dehydrogenase-like predicted oxidoreductase
LWNPEVLLGGYFEKAKSRGKFIFVRSLFLQGLLLLPAEMVEKKMPAAYLAAKKWEGICREYSSSSLEMCFRFAASIPSAVVIGAATPAQAYGNAEAFAKDPLTLSQIQKIYNTLKPYLSEDIINPSKWR